MNPQLVLNEIADAILDGTPVDWSSVDLSDTVGDDALVAQLKTLESLRHRRTRDIPTTSEGWTWGHLRVFERIGNGAHGDVYRAWDTRLAREVALKVLPSDDQTWAPSASTVIEEGRLLARVRHPNVVTIYGAERIDGRVGLWMELVKGRTLEEALGSGRTFEPEEVTRLGIDLCHAVSAVHAAGLLHRDIKTQNIMLDDSGRLVLMDFGTGRELDATDRNIAGTPLYLAPEVLSGGAATPQSETYSIGVVLFRLLTNTYPVSGADLADLRRAHAAGAEGGAPIDQAGIPKGLRRVLARALGADPARRFASVDEMATALAASGRPPRRRWMPIVGVVAAALVLALAGSWNLGLRQMVRPALAAVGLVSTPTVAVLPFTNLGSDPGLNDLLDGLTGEVIGNLANIDGLQVRSQASAFYFQGRPRDLRDIKQQLNVELVIEATVQRAGDWVRINAQLVRTADDVALWRESFDRKLGDLLALQDDIARAIVNKLRLTLGRGQRRYQLSPAAEDLYLRARGALARRGTANSSAAAELFREVIQIAPDHAGSHAGLAEAYAGMTWQLDGLPLEAGLAVMRPAAERAVELDPLLPEALAAMGTTQAYERKWEDARASFERALAMSATTLTGLRAAYAMMVLLPLGEAAEAEALLQEALAFDPLSMALQRDLGIAQYVRGDYDAAIQTLQRVHDADPAFSSQMLARTLTQAGRPADALAVFERRPGNWERWLMPAYVKTGREQDVKRLFDADAHRDDTPHRQAIIYAGLGDKDRTFEALGRAVDIMPHRVPFILACPDMALLRGDERLTALRQRLNLR